MKMANTVCLPQITAASEVTVVHCRPDGVMVFRLSFLLRLFVCLFVQLLYFISHFLKRVNTELITSTLLLTPLGCHTPDRTAVLLLLPCSDGRHLVVSSFSSH